MPDPYYTVNPTHRILSLFDDQTGKQEQIHVDPRLEFRINILWTMPNGTARVEVKSDKTKWVGMVPETRAIRLANFETLFDGRFNDDADHQYIIKRDVARMSLFDEETGRWAVHNVNKNRVKIVERTPTAVKLQLDDNISGWVRGYGDVEITNFGYFFDGRFNESGTTTPPKVRRVTRKSNGVSHGSDEPPSEDS